MGQNACQCNEILYESLDNDVFNKCTLPIKLAGRVRKWAEQRQELSQ